MNLIKKYFEMKKENEKLNKIILDARIEIKWAKQLAEMNQYNSTKVILANVARKLRKIEEILEDGEN